MPLRSSSTPVIGTLLSPFSDIPNTDSDTINNSTKHPPFHYQQASKFSPNGVHHLKNLTSFSCTSSPLSHSPSGFSEFNRESLNFGRDGLRRARSEGYLEGLAYNNTCDLNQFHNLHTQKRSFNKNHKTMLRTAPSFSIFNSSDQGVEDEDEDEDGIDQKDDLLREESLKRTITIGERIEDMGSGEFSFGNKSMGLIKEEEEEKLINDEIQNLNTEEEFEPVSPPMYLATGLGIESIDGFGLIGGTDLNLDNFDELSDVEEYYNSIIDGDPSHPLYLRNYAQFLQSKGDLQGAEDYYHRAMIADPEDGEILMQYAKLVWELYHDQDRALSYFARAARASPQDSNVLAAHASFLWEIEDDREDDGAERECIQIEGEEGLNKLDNSSPGEEIELVSPSLLLEAGLAINVPDFTAAEAGKGSITVEEHYRRMVDENPCNPLVLRNYAQFLWQSKGDLEGAEEYYSRAILADPGDGEIMSQYAKLVWEVHHDHDKALSYFERAIQVSSGDSHILGAYASFLWETEESEEEDSARHDHLQVPLLHEGAVTTTNA